MCHGRAFSFHGDVHRLDGPALIWPEFKEFEWWQQGVRHRDEYQDGRSLPAVVLSDGAKRWYRYGVLHRLDGPALIYANGHKEWYRHGKFLRENDR